MIKPAIPVLSLIFAIVVVPGTNGQDYTLPDSGILPDVPVLYQLKTYVFENLELLLTTDPAERVELRLKFAEIRLAETTIMATRDKPEFVDGLMKEYERHIAETPAEIKKVQDLTRRADVSAIVANAIAKHIAVLESVQARVPVEAQAAIVDAIARSTAQNSTITFDIEQIPELKERYEDALAEIRDGRTLPLSVGPRIDGNYR